MHLSAAAQIGGVLEPVNAAPVIIEDDVLVGGNCGVYEGTLVRARAVLGAGTILTRSTPLYDMVRGEVYRATDDKPLEVPENAVVVPGIARGEKGTGGGVGSFAVHAGDREVSRREDRPEDRAGGVAALIPTLSRRFLRPFRALSNPARPRACARGCILAPLRGCLQNSAWPFNSPRFKRSIRRLRLVFPNHWRF